MEKVSRQWKRMVAGALVQNGIGEAAEVWRRIRVGQASRTELEEIKLRLGERCVKMAENGEGLWQ